MRPSPSNLIGHDDPQSATWTFHQTQQKQIEEDVSGHVANVDYQLVIDEGRGGEGHGHVYCAFGKHPRTEKNPILT